MENTFDIFDIFMIMLIFLFAIGAAIISKKMFNRVLCRNLPEETLREKLNDLGYTFKSSTKIEKKLLPQNIVFNQLWIFLSFCYIKNYYKVLVISNLKNNEEVIYLKYYQSLFLNNKFYFKSSIQNHY
jgi:hypothetical protein